MKYAIGVFVSLSAALVWARSADAQYTATANTGTGVVVFTGSANDDTPLAFLNTAGVLTHNRFMVDAGFASPADMDSTPGNGDQIIMVASLTSLTVNAGAGNDTVTLIGLTGVPGGATITINGEDGNDVLSGGPANETFNGGPGNDAINPGQAHGESNDVNGDSGADTLVLLGDTGDNVIAVSRTSGVLSISIDGAVSSCTYGNLEVCSVAGLAGNDTFTVEPLDNLAYLVDGGGGTDTLNVDAGGNPVIQTSNTITVAGRMPIDHQGIEQVDVTNTGLSVGGDDDDDCGLLGLELLFPLGLAALLRRRS